MERDQKIGLALGILLVGAVAAFFFRHEQPAEVSLPELRTAAELDQQIAQRKQAPYLQPLPPTFKPETTDSAPTPRLSGENPAALPPDPIPLTGDDVALDPLAGTAASPASNPASTEWTYHVVQRGETLSSIAAKYLGSASRYEEIFSLNADRLHDANDLRVGMELRVPTGVSARPAPRTAGLEDRRTSADKIAPSTTSPSESSIPLQFQPYGRSPLTPQGTTPSSSAVDPKEAARKRLTQLPPKGDVSPPR